MLRGVSVILGTLIIFAPFCVLFAAQRRRRAVLWLAGWLAAFAGVAVTVWGLPVALLVWLAAAVDAVRSTRARSEPLRWRELDVLIFLVLACGITLAFRAFVVEAFKISSSSMNPTLQIGDHVMVQKVTPMLGPIERGELVAFDYPCDPAITYLKRVMALAGDHVEVRCGTVYVNDKPIQSEYVPGDCSYDDRYDNEWSTRTCSRYRETLEGRSWDTFSDSERPHRKDAADPRDFPRVDSPFVPSCRQTEAFATHKIEQKPGTQVETKHDAAPCEIQLHYVVPADHLFVLGDNRGNSNDSRVWGSVPVSSVKGRAVGIWLSQGRHGYDWSRFGAVR